MGLRIFCAALATLAATLAPTRAAPPAFDVAPATAAAGRLLPAQAGQLSFTAVERPPGGDYFEVSGSAGAVRVRGTTPAVLLTGVEWYLRNVARVDIGWPGASVSALPATLPAPPAPIRRSATVTNRFALNDTDDGYSGAYRDWASYEHQLDLLALHGVNEVFVQMGAELPYYEALQEFGYDGSELRSRIPAPAHQPWWLLQNMSGFGGPVSEQLINSRAALGRRITDRIRELGMTPVLPGFYGTVPPGFTAKNPGAQVVPQGAWCGFARPDWLDPVNAAFPKVAEAYYRHQKAEFGDSTMYKMDLLHEGGSSDGVDVGAAARAVLTALNTAHPGATWVLLGWQDNPTAAVLDAVDRNSLFILDGLSDRYDQLDREADWHGTPYAFGAIDNFGGHTALGANTAVWVGRFQQWRTRPGSALRGIAYLPEGTGTNPAAFTLFTDLAWQPDPAGADPIDQATWFRDYAAARYGGADPHAAAAWELLRRGPYSLPSGTWSEPQDSLFTARPGLSVASAASWSPTAMRYDPATVRGALTELLQVAPDRRTTDAYHFDLVDVARQALTDRSRDLLPGISAAYEAGDLTGFRRLTAEWSEDLALLDQLVGSEPEFLLGPWLESAKSWGATDAEKARAEYDARSILTTWGPRAGSDGGGVHDYANREWSGLISDFYAARWRMYFATLDDALASGQPATAIDWFDVEDSWAHRRDSYPTTPAGDPYALAARVRDTLTP